MRTSARRAFVVALAALAIAATACNTQGGGGGGNASGTIQADGSSTVFPVTEAMAEEFRAESPDVNVRVGQSGTGGGFEKFCRGETDISNASRPINDDEKVDCADEGVEHTEFKVAIDGLSVVVHKDNEFVECLTTDELKEIWEPGSTVNNWSDVRDGLPNEDIQLYGPGADSGTFDYFTDEINGKEGASRNDYTSSEDDNVLVQGVAGDENALGYFGYAYLVPNTDKVKALGVDAGEGCITPTDETIESGEYSPLSRPLYIYVSNESVAQEHVQAFIEFYLDNVNTILGDIGYIPIPDEDLQASKDALAEAVGGGGDETG